MKIERIKKLVEKKINNGLKPVCVICGENWRGLKWIWNIPAFIDIEVENKDFLRVVCGDKFDWCLKNKPNGIRKNLEGINVEDVFVHGMEFKSPLGKEYMRCTCMKCDTTFIRPRDRLVSSSSLCPACDSGKQGVSHKNFYVIRYPEEKVTWSKWKDAGGK